MNKKFCEKGAFSPVLAVFVLITSLIGVVAGYKAVQKPTSIVPKAQQFRCTDLTQYPNRKCEETLPGPCNYGDWKYQCTGNQGPCLSDAGVGVPYWCGGSLWHNMNFYGECTTACKPQTGSTPNNPSVQIGGNRCFYLTAQFNKTQDGDFDAWVTFNTDDTDSSYHDIKLERGSNHVAGPNRWPRPLPFTYWPEHTGGRIPADSTVTFTGRDDNCAERGNTSSVTCTVRSDGTVEGERCSLRFSQMTATPVPTAAPTRSSAGGPANPAPTNPVVQPTRQPTATPTPTSTPTPTATPTPTRPPEATCGYQGLKCCDENRCELDTLVCVNESFPIIGGKICRFITPTPTATPTSTKTPANISTKPRSQPNIVTRIADKIQEIVKPAENLVKPPEKKSNTGSITGRIKVNNTNGLALNEVFVLLYKDRDDPQPLKAEILNDSYSFSNLEERSYSVKAWVQDNGGRWYQNRSCTPSGDPYDCIVKTGGTKDLTIDIGPQGLRGVMAKTQQVSQKLVSTLSDTITGIPVVGPLIEMFIISAF